MVDTEYMFKELKDDRTKNMKDYPCNYIDITKS